ncbi:hypothetical protein O3G_MSEX001052 [Manduca sexta]|nr:hypothetical protein O3G_MSEX001052 [Manduca sexta]
MMSRTYHNYSVVTFLFCAFLLQMSVLRTIAAFLCGLLALNLCRAQIILPGQCPHVKIMEDFDASRYLGKWYEAEKYFFLFEFGGKCITADYKLKDNGAINVLNKQVSIL